MDEKNTGATIKDVAKAAKVSYSTVSRVLTGDSRISEPTRNKVQRAMEQLGYHPNAIARSLVRRKSNTIGLVLSRSPRLVMSIPFFPEIIGGITEYATSQKYHVLLISSASREDEFAQVFQLLRHKQVEGVIYLTSHMQDELIDALCEEGSPFVVIGRVPGSAAPSVNNDNIAAAEMAVSHLLDQGYTRIAFVGGSPDLVVTRDRMEGYANALTRRSIAVLSDLVACMESTTEAGFAAAERLLALPDRPQAVFAMDDTLAAGVLRSARRRELRVPDELAVVGFNDDPVSSLIDPPLTTVRIPIFEMGQQAARMLIDFIHQGVSPHSVVMPAELIVRQSSIKTRPHTS